MIIDQPIRGQHDHSSANESQVFTWTVLSSPCIRDVLAIWNSRVLGFAMWTAGMSSILFLIFVATSSLEQSEKVKA